MLVWFLLNLASVFWVQSPTPKPLPRHLTKYSAVSQVKGLSCKDTPHQNTQIQQKTHVQNI